MGHSTPSFLLAPIRAIWVVSNLLLSQRRSKVRAFMGCMESDVSPGAKHKGSQTGSDLRESSPPLGKRADSCASGSSFVKWGQLQTLPHRAVRNPARLDLSKAPQTVSPKDIVCCR